MPFLFRMLCFPVWVPILVKDLMTYGHLSSNDTGSPNVHFLSIKETRLNETMGLFPQNLEEELKMETTLADIVRQLEWQTVVLIGDSSNDKLLEGLTQQLQRSQSGVQVLRYNIHNKHRRYFRNILMNIYMQVFPNLNFILVCRQRLVQAIITEADRVDSTSNRTTDFRHSSFWVAVVQEAISTSAFVYLENIALLTKPRETDCDVTASGLSVTRLSGIGNTKHWTHTYLDLNRTSSIVDALFPNVKYGYNNRSFLVATLGTGTLHQYTPGREPSGPIFDILREISLALNFSYDRIIQPADREWGSKVDGKWNGLVGILARRDADLAAAEVTVHEDRYGVVDFVFPEILIDSVDILYRKGELKKATLLDFLRPFQTTVYFCFLAVLVLMPLFYLALQYSVTIGPRLGIEKYHLGDLYQYFMGCVLQQGGRLQPSSCSGRVLVASFWIFCVIMAASYSAMLTASMAVKTEAPPFNNIRELLQRDDYTIGMIASGAPRTILSRTKSGEGKELWSRLSTLNKTDPSIFSLNLQLQLNRVINENYALVIEGAYGKQMVRKDCRLNLLSEKLHWEQKTFALPLGSYLTRDFNRVMMQLKSSGIIQHHIARALKPTRMCDVEEKVGPVGFIDVTGELSLLAAGVGLATVSLVVEKLVTYCKCKHTASSSFEKFRMRFGESKYV